MAHSKEVKFKTLKAYCTGISIRQYAAENNIAAPTISGWANQFISGKLVFKESDIKESDLKDLGISSLEEFKEKLKKVRESNVIKVSTPPSEYTIFYILKYYFDGEKSVREIEKEYGVSRSSIYKYKSNFIKGKLVFDENKLKDIKKSDLDELKAKAMSSKPGEKRTTEYPDSLKLQIIKEYCGVDGKDGKIIKELAKENKLAQKTIGTWIKDFIDGRLVFDEKQFNITKSNIESLKIKASRINTRYSDDFKLTILEEHLIKKVASKEIESTRGIPTGTLSKWVESLRSGTSFDENELDEKQKNMLKTLKEQAILKHQEAINLKDKYNDALKNKVIKELCSGKTVFQIQSEYEVNPNTSRAWKYVFIKNGPYGADNLTEEEKKEFESLRQEEIKKSNINELKSKGDFSWVTLFDEDLEQWAEFANDFMKKGVQSNISAYLSALNIFFEKFVIPKENNVPREVGTFLNRNIKYNIPNFAEVCFSSNSDKSPTRRVAEFINWILGNQCSDEDDFGNKYVLDGFYNPLEKDVPILTARSSTLSQSNKNVLPYRYINTLRSTLCPENATSFKDWNWAQKVTYSKNGGSWFIVDKSVIDKNDPDLVYRKRKSTPYEKTKKNSSDIVYEIWSPVAAVALFVKLTLPLRTYQVRMLDSGEADTEMYVQNHKTKPGEWVENDCKLRDPNINYPVTNGMLRKFVNYHFDIENALEDSKNDSKLSKKEMTGFFINTNKTADINKPANKKGYEIPWEHVELQYWIAKLRDWQKKYNPLDKPTPWTELNKKHFNHIKSKSTLQQMGTSTFLFRNPVVKGEENFPITDGALNVLWYKLLSKLEEDVNKSLSEENSIKFVYENSSRTTFYPLHSLRVSLITAYATDGGVPFHILSKMVAGHSRLIMTLYYTKPNIAYITDMLNKAAENISKNEQKNLEQFLKSAKYEDLKSVIATNDIIGYDALIYARESGWATVLIGDKGICPKGNDGCSYGYTTTDDITGKTVSAPVPGYPTERNCVRCKWFITGPAFLPGLVHHFNIIGYRLSEVSKKMTELQVKKEKLENDKYEYELEGKLFTEQQIEEMTKYQNLYETEVQKCDKLANDYNATLSLIDKCMILSKKSSLKEDPKEQDVQLLTASSLPELDISFRESSSEFEQLQIVCNGAEIFTETDVSKEVLKRSQIFNKTFMDYCNAPVMLYLTEDEQNMAGNQFMRILINKIKLNHKEMDEKECFKKAVSYFDGRKILEAKNIITDTMKDFYETAKTMKLEGATLVIEQSGLLEQNNALEQSDPIDSSNIIEI